MPAPRDEDYAIVSVEPSDPPGGVSGTGWHCYIIEQGDNRIRGYKPGNAQAVRRAVEQIVAQLNERRYSKSGRVHLTLSSPWSKGRSK